MALAPEHTMAKRGKNDREAVLFEIKNTLRELLTARTENAFAIADAISDAHAQIKETQRKGLKQEFGDFCAQVGMSYEHGCKYLKIARSLNLKSVRKDIGHIGAMSTLHSMACLSDQEFPLFKKQCLDVTPKRAPTRDDIADFKRKTQPEGEAAPRSNTRAQQQHTLVTIALDDAATLSRSNKTCLFDLVAKIDERLGDKVIVTRHPAFEALFEKEERE